MRPLTGAVTAVLLLLAGYGAGFPAGKSDGFARGSEWALVQADIVARESGVFMPVYLDQGTFKVVLRQPRNIYKRAWKLADQHEDKTPAAARASDPEQQSAGRVAYLVR